jgi:hypothetical protein
LESPIHVDVQGNPKVYDSPSGHSPVDRIGKERMKDITDAIYQSQDKRIKDAYKQVFGADNPEGK